jgi:hypothetical protein
MCMVLPYSLGSWKYILVAWHTVCTGLGVLGKYYMLLFVLIAIIIGKQAPPLWSRCCSLKSPSFWLSSNSNLCVIFFDMNGMALYRSHLSIFLALHCICFWLVIWPVLVQCFRYICIAVTSWHSSKQLLVILLLKDFSCWHSGLVLCNYLDNFFNWYGLIVMIAWIRIECYNIWIECYNIWT